MPDHLVPLYLARQKVRDLHDLEVILRLVALKSDLSNHETRMLVLSSFDSKIFQNLKVRADSGEQFAQTLLSDYEAIWGPIHTPDEEIGLSTTNYIDPKIDIKNYSTDDLENLLKDIGSLDRSGLETSQFYNTEIVIVNWINHWFDFGKGIEVRDVMLERVNDNTYVFHPVRSALDQLAKREFLAGRLNSAFEIIILSHRLNNGWNRAYSKGAVDRLKWVAAKFPKKWDDFIQSTSLPTDDIIGKTYGLSIGSDLLILFLIEVGKGKKAIDIAEGILTQIEADVKGILI